MTHAALTTSPGLMRRDLDGETVLLDTETGYIHTLNATGRLIWELIENQVSIDGITARIAEEYGLDLAAAQRDTAAFIEQLKNAGLIFESPEPSTER